MITKRSNVRLVGRSTDTKPVNVENGTILFCMNTNKKYIFDAQNKQWRLYTEGYVEPELPAVSATDNGDVLTVVGGKWAKAEPKTLDDFYDVVIGLPAESTLSSVDEATLIKGTLAATITALTNDNYVSVLVKWSNSDSTTHSVCDIVPQLEFTEGNEYVTLHLISHAYNSTSEAWEHVSVTLYWTADGITDTEPTAPEEEQGREK